MKKIRLIDLSFLLYIALLLIVLGYYSESFGVVSEPYNIYFLLMLLGCFASYILIRNIRNRSASLVLWLWFVWPVFGVAYAASFNNLKNIWELPYDISINFYEPIFIHYFFTVFFCAGIMIYERSINYEIDNIRLLQSDHQNKIWQLFLLIFPFYFLISQILSWGGIPLFSGESIINRMYEVKGGIAKSFIIVIFFSVQYSAFKAIINKSFLQRLLWSSAALLFMMISAFDGKRVVLLLSVIGVYQLFIKIKGDMSRAVFAVLLSFSIIAYVAIHFLRSASVADVNLDSFLGLIGVEFMEFAWTVTYYDPGQIPGYSWSASTLASLLNSYMLSLFQIDKQHFIMMDSARSWAALHNTELGIRSGIISELYFEFGYLGLMIISAFGYLFAKLCNLMSKTTSFQNYVFLLSLYSLVFLAIMNQSTMTFGVIPTIVYIWIAWKVTCIASKLPSLVRFPTSK